MLPLQPQAFPPARFFVPPHLTDLSSPADERARLLACPCPSRVATEHP